MSESQNQQLITLPQDSHDKQLWLEVKLLESKLRQIARLSVTESTQSRDHMEQLAIDFIREQWIDGIQGGFYHLVHELCQFSCYQNALVARALFNVDRVVLNGQLSFIAINLLNNLVIRHFNSAQNAFYGDSIVALRNSPICYSEEEINEILNPQEVQLFVQLISGFATVLDSERFYISRFSCSLKRAAEKAGIEYKHAQILESMIRSKLSDYSDSHNQLSTQNTDITEHAEILVTLTQAIIFFSADQFLNIAKLSAEKLFVELNNLDELNDAAIALCYSLIYFCQIKLDKVFLSKIVARFFNLLNSQKAQLPLVQLQLDQLSQQSIYHLRAMRVIFDGILDKNDPQRILVDQLCSLSLPLEVSTLMEPKVVLLDNNLDGHQQKAELLARYDSRLMIFHR